MMKSKRQRKSAATAIKLAELGLAAPQVIAQRLKRMALARPTLSARDRKEFSGMATEKQAAAAQAWMGMLAETPTLSAAVRAVTVYGRDGAPARCSDPERGFTDP